MDTVDTLIIGAGPTGLGAAWRLVEHQHDDWLLVDKNAYFGGLATSFLDEKGFTWDFAVHVAHSHYPYFDHLLQTLLPDGYYEHQRKSWVYHSKSFVPYPFQYNFWHLPESICQECLDGVLNISENNRTHDNAAMDSFEQWIEYSFGAGIAKHFMIPYNRKLWSVDPGIMSSTWLGDRVPSIDRDRVLKNISNKVDDVDWGPNQIFLFPKKGGTGAIWEEMGNRLPKKNVSLSTTLMDLDTQEKIAWLSDGRTYNYNHLISSMPLPLLTKMTKLTKLHEQAQQLLHSQTQVIGLAINTKLPKQFEDKTWIYCPEDELIFYRITPFSTFSNAHVPTTGDWCSFLIEVSYPQNGTLLDESYLADKVIENFESSGLFPNMNHFDRHTYFMSSAYGYPVPSIGRDEILDDIIPTLEAHNIYSRGRFGGWKYEVANMDHSVMQGVEVVDRILLGTKEKTWSSPKIVNSCKCQK